MLQYSNIKPILTGGGYMSPLVTECRLKIETKKWSIQDSEKSQVITKYIIKFIIPPLFYTWSFQDMANMAMILDVIM